MERIRTTCTHCQFGCELEIVRTGRRIVGLEYPEDSPVSGGRLCPRGSAGAVLLDHPQRLCYPLKDGKNRTWQEFAAEAVPIVANCPSNELAVTYDSNLTQEELGLVYGLADQLGTDNLACGQLDPEGVGQWRLDTKLRGSDPLAVSQDDIRKADTTLIVGDVFGVMPVISKLVLDAKYADRSRRLFYLDCLQGRAAGFAHRFLWVRPGQEPLILLALSALLDPRLPGVEPQAIAAVCGTAPEVLGELAQALAKPRKSVVLVAPQFGRTLDPELLVNAAQLLISRIKGTRRLLLATETRVPAGRMSLARLLDRIDSGEIKALLCFGDGFPAEYPGLDRRLSKLSLVVSTATLRPRAAKFGWVLPVPLALEKEGSVTTLWGTARIAKCAEPPSGAHGIAEIIRLLAGELPASDAQSNVGDATAPIQTRVSAKSICEQGQVLLKSSPAKLESCPFTILAERPAYSFLGLFPSEKGWAGLNPGDARGLRVGERSRVTLETQSGNRAEFRVRLDVRVAPGTVVVDSNELDARGLFDVTIDKASGVTRIPPVQGRLWPSE
ncbi:MAG: hypothetical protein ABIK62_05140 [candidate division WOR-3 bacterium]